MLDMLLVGANMDTASLVKANPSMLLLSTMDTDEKLVFQTILPAFSVPTPSPTCLASFDKQGTRPVLLVNSLDQYQPLRTPNSANSVPSPKPLVLYSTINRGNHSKVPRRRRIPTPVPYEQTPNTYSTNTTKVFAMSRSKRPSAGSADSLPRLFVGLSLPTPVINSLQTLVQPARLPHARWLAPSTWHITLHFLGAAPLPVIQSALSTVSTAPFDIQLKSAGIFGISSRPRIFWAGVQATPGLLALHAAVGDKLVAAGFQTEKRPYSPHVSLAKIKCKDTREEDMLWTFAEENVAFQSPVFRVETFTLFESIHTEEGTTYVSRGDYMVQGMGGFNLAP